MEGENYDIVPNSKIIIESLIKIQARQEVFIGNLIGLLVPMDAQQEFVDKINLETGEKIAEIVRQLYASYGPDINLEDLQP